MLHYRTRRRLFSTLVLLVAYVTLPSPIAFVMIASFDYGQRAYVVFPPEQFTLESYWRIPTRYWGLTVDQRARRVSVHADQLRDRHSCRDRYHPLQPTRQGGAACGFPGTDADPGGGFRAVAFLISMT